ncbi:MAG: isopentenyl-diphosphate Delta-isomerase [Bacteroidetes bacterium]|nr:isopentenyl-diphosphate Delta-isomerase [Bacteroidota bacterium]
MLEEEVILVNEFDEVQGYIPKLEAHQKGLLHRAFSVFVFNDNGELLLQKRADDKYHSPGLWSNTCCSHPRKDEITHHAALRRLQEEMGIQTSLQFLYSFIYNEPLGNGLFEHEFDHVFVGRSSIEPIVNSEEVSSWKYISIPRLVEDVKQHPEQYTIWFRISLPVILKKLNTLNNI